MKPETFRADPHLRSSGYHLATWSLVAFVLDLRLRSLPPGEGASAMAMAVVLLGGGLLTSYTHERRVGKIAGVPGEPVWPGAPRLWRDVAVAVLGGSVALAALSWSTLVFPLWCLAVGVGFARWGKATDFVWYAGFGQVLAAVGVLDLVVISIGQVAAGLAFRSIVLGLAVPGFALATNQRFLWPRVPR